MPNPVRAAVFRNLWQEQCGQKMPGDGWALRKLLIDELSRYVVDLPDEPLEGAWTEASEPSRVTRRLALLLLRGGNNRDEAASFYRLAVKRTSLLEARVAQGAAGGESSALPMAHVLESLIGPLMELGHMDEARELLMRPRPAAAGPRQSLDEAVHAENLAAVLQANGQLPEAEVLVRKALGILEKAFPASARDVRPAGARARLAQLLHLQGRSAEGERLLRASLREYEESLGPEHTQTLQCVRNLAVMLKQLPEARHAEVLPEADALLQRAAKGLTDALGGEHPESQRVLRNLMNFRRWVAGRQAATAPANRKAATEL
eukprot:TRINITY_DN85385_c0_g1_i1.p1 TRINITY_DN85385_c0_g1~~TRINITY_DN85385_c0_g1_i1.p1  ORF type:complete len:355 (-),score=86.49 TRINITY_DN85385_c0_g1_i1:38-994(-)